MARACEDRPVRRVRLVTAAVILSAAVSGAGAGCAPGTPDDDSWRTDAQRAVSDTASAVHSAELGLRLSEDDKIFDHYLQTVVVDAEEAAGVAGDTIGGTQPPPAERERYDTVTGQIEEAAGLLSTTRIAVVDREDERYAALADRLASSAAALQRLEDELQHPPAPAAR